MENTYELKVSYTQGQEIATWIFNREDDEGCCKVKQGDKIQFVFDGPGDVAECVVLCGQMGKEWYSSPFVEGNRINLKNSSLVTVGEEKGRWGFSIAFTARNSDSTTSFYYVPDPEVRVDSRPGSDD